MNDNIVRIIKKKFDSLPESIQEIILSSDYEETLAKIEGQYQLNAEQMSILERETTLVMMGLTPSKDFGTELARELKVDNSKGFQIAQDINEKIFSKVEELLRLMNAPVIELKLHQNLDFILSGGDYSAFVEEREPITPETTQPTKKIPVKPTIPPATPSITPPTLADIKANTQNLSNQLELPSRAGTNVPVKPNKMEDIKKAN